MIRTDTIIVGGGISGLTVAHRLQQNNDGHQYILLEKESRTGGAIQTFHEAGYTAELGPHGFLDNCAETQDLLEKTGLMKECVKAPLQEFVRYVLMQGELRLIPQTPVKILMAPLISWKDKLRVLGDLWQKPLQDFPTVAQWVEHRFGKAILPFADAAFTGTYAGDIDQLTMDAVMPGIRQLELQYGSLLRGLLAKAGKSNRKNKRKRLCMPAMVSFPQGMETLPRHLSKFFTEGKDLFTNCSAQELRYHSSTAGDLPTATLQHHASPGIWEVQTSRGNFFAPHLVIALPINQTTQLLATSPVLAPPAISITEAALATAVFSFAVPEKIPPGFGYLSPKVEKRFSLGTLFSSNMFPKRAPEGCALIETLVGGTRNPELLALSDNDIMDAALQDVSSALKLQTQPAFKKLLRNPGVIPQLDRKFLTLQAWQKEITQTFSNLSILGFGWNGIGINDMIKHACSTAEDIIHHRAVTQGNAEIKKIYF